jgi:hypothetical protein
MASMSPEWLLGSAEYDREGREHRISIRLQMRVPGHR